MSCRPIIFSLCIGSVAEKELSRPGRAGEGERVLREDWSTGERARGELTAPRVMASKCSEMGSVFIVGDEFESEYCYEGRRKVRKIKNATELGLRNHEARVRNICRFFCDPNSFLSVLKLYAKSYN